MDAVAKTPDGQIQISASLQALFSLPDCGAVSPPPFQPQQIRLPNGATLKSMPDLSKGVPTDCSLAHSLLIQLAPFLASIDCLLKVLKLLKPLIDIIKLLVEPTPPNLAKLPGVVPDFLEAAGKLLPCFGILMPAIGIFNFIKDILLAILRILKCVIGTLESVLAILTGLEIKIADAKAAGNAELERILNCARENAVATAEHAAGGMGPVMNIIELIGPFLEIAGITIPLTVPVIDVSQLDALKASVQGLRDTVTQLENIVKTLP